MDATEITQEVGLTEVIPDDIDYRLSLQMSSAPGLELNALRELLVIQAKADRAMAGFNLLYSTGHRSWSSVDAYHTCLLLLRQMLGFYGLFTVQSNGKSFVLDLYPAYRGKSKKALDAYALMSKGLVEPVLWATIEGRRLEHKHLWEIFQRVVRVLQAAEIPEANMKWARKFDFPKYSSTRNKIIYNGAFWPDMADLYKQSTPTISLRDEAHYLSFQDGLWQDSWARDQFLLLLVADLATHFRVDWLPADALSS